MMAGSGYPAGEYIPTEGVALVAYTLARGRTLTTAQAAELAGISRQGAWVMLTKIARVLPILGPTAAGEGRWRIEPDEET